MRDTGQEVKPPSPINIATIWRLFGVVLNLEETSLSWNSWDGKS